MIEPGFRRAHAGELLELAPNSSRNNDLQPVEETSVIADWVLAAAVRAMSAPVLD